MAAEEKKKCQEFYWTARLFVDGKAQEARYFPTETERDEFVAGHSGWKKRGKICVENLEQHLAEDGKVTEG